MLNLEHFSINRIKDGRSEKSYFYVALEKALHTDLFTVGLKVWKLLTRLHSTSQSKNQLHFKVV